MCPFSSLYQKDKDKISEKGNKKKKSRHQVVIDLSFEGRLKQAVNTKERVPKVGSIREEITERIYSCIEFHNSYGQICLQCETWQPYWRWNTGSQFITAVTKIITVEKDIEKPPCSVETEGQ